MRSFPGYLFPLNFLLKETLVSGWIKAYLFPRIKVKFVSTYFHVVMVPFSHFFTFVVVTSLKGYLKVGFYYSYENKLNKPCLIMIALAFTIWLILFHQLKPFFSSFILTLCTRKSAKYESQKTGTITVNISLTNVAIFFYSHHKCRNCL